jgi:hypothetical protein
MTSLREYGGPVRFAHQHKRLDAACQEARRLSRCSYDSLRRGALIVTAWTQEHLFTDDARRNLAGQ